jgi:hypothetical protein
LHQKAYHKLCSELEHSKPVVGSIACSISVSHQIASWAILEQNNALPLSALSPERKGGATMAGQNDPRREHWDDSRFGPSNWPAGLQFIWGLLNDRRRFRRLVILVAFLVIVLVAALLALKASYSAVLYDLGQHERHSFVYSTLTEGIGGCIVGGFAAMRYRKSRRARLAKKRPTAKPRIKAPGEQEDDGLSEPGED